MNSCKLLCGGISCRLYRNELNMRLEIIQIIHTTLTPPPPPPFLQPPSPALFKPLSQYQCIYNTHLRPPPHQSPPHPPHPNLYCFPNHPFQASSPHHLQYHDTLFSFSPFFKSCPPLSFPTYMDSDCCKKLHQF